MDKSIIIVCSKRYSLDSTCEPVFQIRIVSLGPAIFRDVHVRHEYTCGKSETRNEGDNFERESEIIYYTT